MVAWRSLGGVAAVGGPLGMKIVKRDEVGNAEPARADASDD